MQILDINANSGAWAGYGTLGYWTPAVGVAAPPAGLTITGAGLSANTYTGPADRRMELPAGGVVANTYAGSPDVFVALTPTGSIDWVVSMRLLAPSSRTAYVDIRSPDGATVYATSALTPDLYVGVWVRVRVTGPCRIVAYNTTAPRYQGVLFDPFATASPGRLLCFEPGVSGLIG